jgi:hypothetical protein
MRVVERREMGHSRKEPLGKKAPSPITAREAKAAVELLLKLNAELREKISRRRKREEPGAENMEMVIIILNSAAERTPRAPRAEKPKLPKNSWIDDLCKKIEGESGRRKGSI